MLETNNNEIKQLTPEVVDQIAAGEVVERPAHLVKELIENSIDAGAKKIVVEVAEGGRWVKVTDDGKGMEKADLNLALDRFATSKINAAEDLWNLASFGFRGEALASISSVSQVTIISRRTPSDNAWKLVSEFGKRAQIVPVGGGFGTSILIEKLFENVPARLKFLKTDAGEISAIRNVLKALALAHPHLEIRYTENGKLYAYWSCCESRLTRVQQILEIESLFTGEANRGPVNSYAVFADPKTVAKSSRNIWIFVQNRWVQDRSIQAAVTEAYRSLLMHGEFPQAVIWVETLPDFVDVNIHPTKSQVKFQDASLAFRAVQASIRDHLEKAPWIARDIQGQPGDIFRAPPIRLEDLVKKPQASQLFSSDVTQFKKKVEIENLPTEKLQISTQPQMVSSTYDSGTVPIAKGFWQSLEVVSQVHLTYILCQSRESMILVDQHAAHERVVYEKLMKSWKGGKVDIQEYLIPPTIELPPERMEAMIPYLGDLEKLGVFLEPMGMNLLGIKAAPSLLKEKSLLLAINEMSQEVYSIGGSFSVEKYISHVCATLACHSVVRAGQAMNLDEMKCLLANMDEFPLSSFCPHGRPVSIEYPWIKIEKEFGRLV